MVVGKPHQPRYLSTEVVVEYQVLVVTWLSRVPSLLGNNSGGDAMVEWKILCTQILTCLCKVGETTRPRKGIKNFSLCNFVMIVTKSFLVKHGRRNCCTHHLPRRSYAAAVVLLLHSMVVDGDISRMPLH